MFFKVNPAKVYEAIRAQVPASDAEVDAAYAKIVSKSILVCETELLTNVQTLALGMIVHTRGSNIHIANAVKHIRRQNKTHAGTVAWYRCAYNAGRIKFTKLKTVAKGSA